MENRRVSKLTDEESDISASLKEASIQLVKDANDDLRRLGKELDEISKMSVARGFDNLALIEELYEFFFSPSCLKLLLKTNNVPIRMEVIHREIYPLLAKVEMAMRKWRREQADAWLLEHKLKREDFQPPS
jgi:hypothetical protein